MMQLSPNARAVLERRYLKRGEDAAPQETPEELFERVALAIAESDRPYGGEGAVQAAYEIFYAMMTNLEFLPNSPTLMNAGRPLGQLSACFVLPVEDSMEAIFEAIKQAALIHKSGGGTGFSFSRLRPKGSMVNSTGGVASGPVSFLKVFNTATEAVKQGGTRRGANMGILRVDHPDILEFIDCKADNSEITNFNLSVGLTEAFMQAVEQGQDYDLIDPHTKGCVGKENARRVFEKMVDAAWRNGEPGIVFLDRLNRDNIVPGLGEIESTNPCGEQPLLPYESCNLGSINLTRMIREDNSGFAWDRLEKTVQNAVNFLDNVIDANQFPLRQIEEATKKTRKIGLGVMGWADSLLRLGIPYNSEEAVALGENLMRRIQAFGRAKSAELARERGAFPLFSESTHPQELPLRNATVTTIAPTGTLSILANCSSGIEPVFGYVYVRNVMDSTQLLEVNPVLKAELERRGLYSDALLHRIAQEGTVAGIEELPEELRRVFVCAHDVSPEYHIRMQAAFQNATDNAVSKTVNFSRAATRREVARVYRLAFELGCKGVTIYRDGSREGQVLNLGEDMPDKKKSAQPRPRPDVVTGLTERVQSGCGSLYVTVNHDDQGICEVFTNTGKAGGCPSQSEATARLISIALRSGIDVDVILRQLKGIRCPSTLRQPGRTCTSCPDAIARVIEKVYRQREDLDPWPPLCPECGAPLEHEGGCISCRQCGYGRCG